MADLTDKQQRFVREYLKDLNATRAAKAAGYSTNTANEQASRLLANVKVAEAVQKAMDRRSKRTEITADRVLSELAKLAFVDPKQFFNQDGSAKPIHELDDETAAALAGMEVVEEFEGKGAERRQVGYVKKFKFADKGVNLERLGRHLKLFTDKMEVSGNLGQLSDDELRARLEQLRSK